MISKNKKSLVSVIMPFYKNLSLLKKSLKSVLQQSYTNYEIILINDNPKKNLNSALKNILINSKKIKIINNKINCGAGLSRNKGIKYSKGEYIAFLDSDDIWSKKKLETQIMFMKNRNILASHTSYQIVNLDGHIISTRNARNLTYEDLLRSCDIGLSTVVLNKKILKNDSKLFPDLVTKEDFVLWLKISKKGVKFYGINKYLSKWRSTPNSLSKSTMQKIRDAVKVYKNYQSMSIFKSLYYTFLLSMNYIFKKWK